MPYWIHGLDNKTRESSVPFFSDADDEVLAREQAESQGIIVYSVERHVEDVATHESTLPTAPPYEFTKRQSDVIQNLAFLMRLTAVISMTCGGIILLATFKIDRPISGFIIFQGWVALLIGGLTYVASNRFRRIVKTRGSDMDHLMGALSTLSVVYLNQLFIAVGGVVFGLLIVVAAIGK